MVEFSPPSIPGGTRLTRLFGVWASGPSDAWAVGDGIFRILHWDGSAWSGSSSGAMNGVNAVWGAGPKDVWAGGGQL